MFHLRELLKRFDLSGDGQLTLTSLPKLGLSAVCTASKCLFSNGALYCTFSTGDCKFAMEIFEHSHFSVTEIPISLVKVQR